MQEHQIISFLRKNARMGLTEISRKTGVPVSTLHDWIKRKQQKIIVGYTSLLNFTSLGFPTQATIMIRVDKNNIVMIQEFLLNHPAINNLSRISNGYDFALEGVFVNLKGLQAFLDELEARFIILDAKYFLVIESLKREGFLPEHQSYASLLEFT